MPHPLVIAYHLVWTTYGWWLPNDPRGSSSHAIRNDVLAELGDLHHGRKKVQPAGRVIRGFYESAAELLTHPLVTFDGAARELIASGFADAIARHRYTCYACAIMPDHAHALIRKHKHQAEQMIANLQRESHFRLREAGRFDLQHPVWGGHGWSVFLDHPDDIRRTIPYIENNPLERRLPKQTWDFVKEYDGWPLHPGHSPNSPYVRRLRESGRGG